MFSTSSTSSRSSYIFHPPFLTLPDSHVFLLTGVWITPPVRLSLAVESIGLCRPWTTGRQQSVLCRAVGGGIAEEDEGRFLEAVLGSGVPVLVEFVAKWCGPCRLISPALEWLTQESKERLRVAKIDHDANTKLIEEYKVYRVLTLILFMDGEEVPDSRREGAITKTKFKEYLDPLLASISVSEYTPSGLSIKAEAAPNVLIGSKVQLCRLRPYLISNPRPPHTRHGVLR